MPDPKSGILELFGFFRLNKSPKRQFLMLFRMAVLKDQDKWATEKYLVLPALEILFFSKEDFFIIRKRILLQTRLEPLTLRVRTCHSINWAIQAIDNMCYFIVKFIYDIEMKMCSNKFVSRINEDFLQWESSRHHLWLI